jgi:hypothetical protein
MWPDFWKKILTKFDVSPLQKLMMKVFMFIFIIIIIIIIFCSFINNDISWLTRVKTITKRARFWS